jgi:glycosyltransferase involved in cell wall biosynthesis
MLLYFKACNIQVTLLGYNLPDNLPNDSLVSDMHMYKPSYLNNSFYGWIDNDFIKLFQDLIDKNDYDFINIHYIQLAEIAKYVKVPDKCKLIYTMHDANFIQQYYTGSKTSVGMNFEEESNILSLFDAVTCISYDEKLLFEHILPDVKFYFLPPLISPKLLPDDGKDIDVLFLAYDNPYNREGLIWFIDHVLPLIDIKINITICGAICEGIKNELPDYYKKIHQSDITMINFCEDLDELFKQTKLSICPLFKGTGMKIKTIDSMARGIPVVSTPFGVDGFPDKFENGCLVADKPEQFAKNIVSLLTDSDFYSKTKMKMIEYIGKYFPIEKAKNTLDDVLFDSFNKSIKKITKQQDTMLAVNSKETQMLVMAFKRKYHFYKVLQFLTLGIVKIFQKRKEKYRKRYKEIAKMIRM